MSQSRSSPILASSLKSCTLCNSLVIIFLDSYALTDYESAHTFP